jgi:type IV pilus assembly protein PilE
MNTTAHGMPRRASGFTLIELMIVVTILAIIAAVGYPNYTSYVKNGARQAAQTEMVQMASLQEKIFLNSNSYTANLTTAYTGQSAGGLGNTTGKSADGKYTYSLTATANTYTLTATPTTGGTMVGDGNLTLSADGTRLWGSKPW